MENRTRHCPHLGLKHTRSIRFSSPTPEHRCYIFGEPLPIQVDQRTFCLGERYPDCPRFAGQEPPPAPASARPARGGAALASGLAAFWQALSGRERFLYLSLVGLLVLILATYGLIVGVILPARSRALTPTVPEPSKVALSTPVHTAPVLPTVAPTALPTAVPTVRPTTVLPTAAPVPTTAAPAPTTVAPSSPTAAPPPTTVPPLPTATPRPTSTPVPPTAVPTPASMMSLLYFLGPERGYFVPVWRESQPYTEGVARRALNLMIEGPRAGTQLLRSMPEGMGLNNVYRVGGTLYVDLDHTFEQLNAGQKEAMAVVLAMTEFSTVEEVQFLVNQQPYGLPGSGGTGPVRRPAYVNFEDPYGVDPANASNLILYFATPDERYLFPMVRRVPYTVTVATNTINEMIKGPGPGYRAVSTMPEGTRIQKIYRSGDTIVVDFNSAFLNARNRDLTVNALVLAMVDLTADENYGVKAVRISVDGVDLGAYWGAAYSGDLCCRILNYEGP